MPEIHFKIQWPDGSQEMCYSPSLVVKQYFQPETDYPLQEFVEKSRTSLQIASDRVQKKYGFPCSRALGQLAKIETTAAQYAKLPEPRVRVLDFVE